MKTCNSCGLSKPLEEYHRHKHYKDGRRSQCKECCCAKRRASYDPEKGRAYAKQWRTDNPTRYKAYYKEYTAREREQIRERDRVNAVKRYHRNPEKYREIAARRRAQSKYNVSYENIYALNRKRNRGVVRCDYCHTTDAVWNVDHIIPLAKNGRHREGNLCIACESCNKSKHDKLPIEFKVKVLRR